MDPTGQQPLVSIVTPSYNQAPFIEEAILSVSSQDYPFVEHIIVDGGSTDGSVEIIKAYARRSPDRIRWVSEPDEGQADAINKGFRMATGQIVAWLNSDDTYLFRSTLSEVVDAFHRMPEADIIYGDAVLIDKDNRLLRVLCSPSFSYNWLLRGCRLTQPTVFFRQQVIGAEKLAPPITVVLDYEFWLRLGRKYRFVHVPRLWATDRNHSGRKILARRDELVRQSWAVRRQYGQDMDAPYYLQHHLDKLLYGLPSLVKGLLALPGLYHADAEAFAIPLRLEPPISTIWRQLWKKNRDLI